LAGKEKQSTSDGRRQWVAQCYKMLRFSEHEPDVGARLTMAAGYSAL
jgi:hypothetical protein